jgi:hypothetical protein
VTLTCEFVPAPLLENLNAATKPGVLRVERSARLLGTTMTYLAPFVMGGQRGPHRIRVLLPPTSRPLGIG